ncbi:MULTISPECIES: CaiB/BaiF CoA transferase family protein [Pseudomonas]|uniref:CaiB/BaiF CoA transferase family protein n=1 Tax=Pseudomonas TaxID=286 RepID=UPI000760E8BC|nr:MULTISPECIES: CoA transferase [Pseudomonas]
MANLLEGIRILDVTRYVAGPVCTALLSDLGADVIRIEPPGGGEDRTPLPFAEGFHGGVGFTQTNRNKRGLTLDLSCERGKAVFERLLRTTDIVVANLPPSSVKSLGLDYERLSAIKPDIIFLHLTTFGTSGPFADRLGFDAIAQVMSGTTHLSGDPDKPMKNAAAWVDMATGFLGAYGLMAALRHRDVTGQGQQVEANLLQTAMTVSNYFLIDEAFNEYGRVGTGNRAQSGGPADLIRTRDGWVYMVALGNPMFKRWARMVGREVELLSDPRFASDESRAVNGEVLTQVATEWAKQYTTAEVLAELARNKIPAGPLLSPAQVLSNEQISEEYLQQVPVEGLSKPVPYVKSPVAFSKTPAQIKSGPPTAGAHNTELLQEAGFSLAEIEALRTDAII